MQKIRNILLVVDDSNHGEAFIAEVAAVTKDSGAQVTLLSVFDMPPDDLDKSAESSELRKWMMEAQMEQMQAISAELVKSGIQVTIKQPSGKPYLEIIREVIRGSYDLVMKPAKSEPTVKTFLFGSTDMQLFRLCPCPVWAFKPTTNTELRRIMIAVDLQAYDLEKSALSDKILQWGMHVASLAGSELHVVHIWNLYGEAKLRSSSLLADTINRLEQDNEHKHFQLLNEALEKNGLKQKEVQIHFYKGEANKLIPEIAKAVKTDLLVMGTVGRTGIPGFFIGNTAESVLRQVDCSVLAIKPDGFSTPVEL